ncbi:hypothetical protein [Herbidospora sp. RD11066]
MAIRVLGAASILAAPVLTCAADQLRMAAEGAATETGIVTEWGREQAVAQSASIAANLGTYQAAAWLALAAALVGVPAVVALWWAARDTTWARVGLVFGVLGVIGQVVHLVAYYGLQLGFATGFDPGLGYDLTGVLEGQAFFTALFVPYFFAFLAFLPQSVGLYRAGQIPVWAMGVVVAGTIAFAVLGSTPVVSAVWLAALLAGLAPLALRMARN